MITSLILINLTPSSPISKNGGRQRSYVGQFVFKTIKAISTLELKINYHIRKNKIPAHVDIKD
jgi:hypothetical protein